MVTPPGTYLCSTYLLHLIFSYRFDYMCMDLITERERERATNYMYNCIYTLRILYIYIYYV